MLMIIISSSSIVTMMMMTMMIIIISSSSSSSSIIVVTLPRGGDSIYCKSMRSATFCAAACASYSLMRYNRNSGLNNNNDSELFVCKTLAAN